MGSPVVDTTVFSRVLYQLSYLAARASLAAAQSLYGRPEAAAG
jgi:hypothetical protein